MTYIRHGKQPRSLQLGACSLQLAVTCSVQLAAHPHPHPSRSVLPPPGGASTRLVGRSVMKLPTFWLAPLAKALLPDADRVRAPKVCCCGGMGGAAARGTSAAPKATPAPNALFPPGGACSFVLGRPRMELPSFWSKPTRPVCAPRRCASPGVHPTPMFPPPSPYNVPSIGLNDDACAGEYCALAAVVRPLWSLPLAVAVAEPAVRPAPM